MNQVQETLVPAPTWHQLDDERYRVHSPHEVLSILQALQDGRELVTIHFGDGDVVVSMILGVDGDAGTLFLDVGPDAYVNQRLLRAERLLILSQLNHIRVQFVAQGASTVDLDGSAAFAIFVPDSLLRVQRRDFFRVRLATTRPVRCELPVDENGRSGASFATAIVTDISCGGVALADVPVTLPCPPGAVYQGCRLLLPDASPLTVDLEIVRSTPGPLARRTVQNVGARFLDIDERTRSRIQHFVNEMQRRQLARQS